MRQWLAAAAKSSKKRTKSDVNIDGNGTLKIQFAINMYILWKTRKDELSHYQRQ